MKITRDLFYYERPTPSTAILQGHRKLGDGDSLYNDFSYDHRFLITGKWYFRAGVEYERYDFGGTDNGLPDHLQAAVRSSRNLNTFLTILPGIHLN